MSAHEKACTKCGVVKSLDDFHRTKRAKSGRQSHCKGCRSEQARRYYEENRDKIGEKSRRYGKENRDKMAEYYRRYGEENRDKIAEYRRRYREENRDKIVERKRRYREENRDYLKAKSLNYKMGYRHTSELFRRTPKGTPWTPEEEAFLLANDGRTYYQKAIELGRTYASVSGRLQRLRKAQAQ